LHLITLILVACLQFAYVSTHGTSFEYRHNDAYHFVLHLFFASDWGLGGGFSLKKPDWDAGLSFNGPMWSISVEVLAYAAFFFLARRLRFKITTMVKIILFLVVAKMTLPWIKDIVLCQLYFFIGGAVYLLASQDHTKSTHLRIVALSAVLAAILVIIDIVTDGRIDTITLISVTVALLLSFHAIGMAIRSRAILTAFCTLGNLTYSSYLIHFPLQIATLLALDHLGISNTIYLSPLAMVAFLLFVFILSHASYVVLERPLQEWLRVRLMPTAGRRQLREEMTENG